MNSSIPITPNTELTPSTSPFVSRKRRNDSDYTPPSSPIVDFTEGKKFQSQRIFSEAHVYTVNLMLEASRSLPKNDHIVNAGNEDGVAEDQRESSFRQKPFWPEVVRKH